MGDFTKARVGNRVESWRFGKGIIVGIYPDQKYPVRVSIPGRGLKSYTYEGYYPTDKIRPDLFWGEIKFEEPPPPKRKTVRIERWLVVQRASSSIGDGFALQSFLSEPGNLPREVHRWHREIEFEVDEE